MSPSPFDSPTDARHYKTRDRRVSFDIGTTNASKAAGFFSHLAAATAATAPAPSKPRHDHNHASRHGHDHSRSQSHSHHSHRHPDRRTRVEDDVDEGNESAGDHAKAKSKPAPGVAGQGSLPTTTASAAAAGFSNSASAPAVIGISGVNPAVGANPLFTHLNNGGFPQQPYTIQAYPSMWPAAMAQAYPFAPGMAGAVNGVDPTSITGVSFLPAVPDATNGPMLHTYIPRNDAPGSNNIVYMQQPQYQPAFNTVSHLAQPLQQCSNFPLPFMPPSLCCHQSRSRSQAQSCYYHESGFDSSIFLSLQCRLPSIFITNSSHCNALSGGPSSQKASILTLKKNE